MRLARTSALPAQLARHEALPLTYPEVGATSGPLPLGYHHVQRRTHLGHGPETFTKAADALLTWRIHERAGLHLAAAGPVAPDRTVIMGVGFGLCLVVPCRVVDVVDEPDRRGFAYGTLPGHPESGEELFLIERQGDDVWFTITSFSRPGSRLTALAGPIARLAQTLTTVRYEKAATALAHGRP